VTAIRVQNLTYIRHSRVSPPVLGGVAAASADGVVFFDDYIDLPLQLAMLTTRVSPPVLGGVAAASADGVVLFDDYIDLAVQLAMLTTRVSPPVLGGVAAASADGVVLFVDHTPSHSYKFKTAASPPVLGGWHRFGCPPRSLNKNLILLNYHPASQSLGTPPKQGGELGERRLTGICLAA